MFYRCLTETVVLPVDSRLTSNALYSSFVAPAEPNATNTHHSDSRGPFRCMVLVGFLFLSLSLSFLVSVGQENRTQGRFVVVVPQGNKPEHDAGRSQHP